MPLDANIFLQGAALKQRNAENFGQTLNGVVDAFKKDKSGLDLTKLAEAAVYKYSMGIEPNEQEIAAVRAKGMLDGSKTEYKPDEKGNIRAITNPSPYAALAEILGGKKGPAGMPAYSTPMVPSSVVGATGPTDAMIDSMAKPGPNPFPQGPDMGPINQARVANAGAVNQPASLDIEALMAMSGNTPDPVGTLPAPPNEAGLNMAPLLPQEIAGNPNATQKSLEQAVSGNIDIQKKAATDALDIKKTQDQAKIAGFELEEGVTPTDTQRNDLVKISASYQQLQPMMTEYRKLIDKYGSPLAGTAEAKELDRVAAQIQMTLKELEGLGALQQPDIIAMGRMMGNPVMFSGTMGDVISNPVEAINSTVSKYSSGKQIGKDSVDSMQKYLDAKMTSAASARGYRFKGAPKGSSSAGIEAELKRRKLIPND